MLPFTIRRSLAAVCLCLLGLAPACGQTPSVPSTSATNAPATNAPSTTPPVTPIATGDVVTQAESTLLKLRDDQNSFGVDPVSQIVSENLPILIHQIDERVSDDTRLLAASPSLSSLHSAQAAWQALANTLGSSEQALTDRVNLVEARLTELDQQTRIWQATLASAKTSAAPAVVVPRINAVLSALSDAAKSTQTTLARILSVQAGVAAQSTRISNGLAGIAKAQETARSQLFEQDHPPLWRTVLITHAGQGVVAQEKASLTAQLGTLETYLDDKIPAVFIHLLILVLLFLGFHLIRKAIKTHAQEEAALHHAAQVFDVPLATALLLALVATDWLYPLAPRLLWAAVGAIALIPAVIIIRRLIERANFPLLYATVIAYFVDQLRYVVTPAGIASRLLLILELLAASIFLLTVLHSKHLSASPLDTSRLKRLTRIYLHLAFAVFVFAGGANVFGYVHLSLLVGNGMLESSYLAVILYAAVRITDALVLSAMSIRPLKNLGMVRHYHDLLYDNLSKLIRWLAFVLWVVAALQLFSIRDPLWQWGAAFLATPFHWGSISFSLDQVLAFGITVWASFLLSRFIRFALEEEVYPNLHLSRGIPYAASTMVHYLILVVGFFAALEALGIDLSKFSILAGAFGVGLGFGLQNIFNNFVSGVILLFERPVKVGDIVQIGTDMGRVESIGIRASVILLTNGSELIVPNGNLISNPVTNWTLSSCDRLLEISINVTSKVDPQQVLKLLVDAAKAHPDVLKNPPPQALLVTFGAALTFRLRAWTDSEEEWMKITSDLSLAINAALARENIAIS